MKSYKVSRAIDNLHRSTSKLKIYMKKSHPQRKQVACSTFSVKNHHQGSLNYSPEVMVDVEVNVLLYTRYI